MQLNQRLALTYRFRQVSEEHVVGEVEELELGQREEGIGQLRQLVGVNVEVLYCLIETRYGHG